MFFQDDSLRTSVMRSGEDDPRCSWRRRSSEQCVRGEDTNTYLVSCCIFSMAPEPWVCITFQKPIRDWVRQARSRHRQVKRLWKKLLLGRSVITRCGPMTLKMAHPGLNLTASRWLDGLRWPTDGIWVEPEDTRWGRPFPAVAPAGAQQSTNCLAVFPASRIRLADRAVARVPRHKTRGYPRANGSGACGAASPSVVRHWL